VGTTTPVQSIASTSMVDYCHKYAHENAVKMVNKRPRNLLNKIQNVFINDKQVKTGKTTQIIHDFHDFYAKTTIPATHMPTCANSDLCTVTTPTDGGFRLRPTR